MHNLRLMSKERLIYFDDYSWSPKNRPICDQAGGANFPKPLIDICHWWISIAVFSCTSASSAASPTGYSLAQKYIKSNHFWSVNLDFAKKLPSRTVFLPLHLGQHQLTPSETSLLLLSVIGTAHLIIIHFFSPCMPQLSTIADCIIILYYVIL